MCEDVCDYNHEGLCILPDETGETCRFADENGFCTAKESDLIEVCPDCDQPVDECDCGTNLVIVKDARGKMALVTPKRYAVLKEMDKKLVEEAVS